MSKDELERLIQSAAQSHIRGDASLRDHERIIEMCAIVHAECELKRTFQEVKENFEFKPKKPKKSKLHGESRRYLNHKDGPRWSWREISCGNWQCLCYGKYEEKREYTVSMFNCLGWIANVHEQKSPEDETIGETIGTFEFMLDAMLTCESIERRKTDHDFKV